MKRNPLFTNKKIRRILHNDAWWFSVVDMVSVLTKSRDPRAYWRRLKKRLIREGSDAGAMCVKLRLPAADGKWRATECADMEGVLRIVQSIPTPKAESAKRWIARAGYEREQESENPELAADRSRRLYQAKGYTEEWIQRRLQGIVVRGELTDEWKNRGARKHEEYELLTNEMSKAIFDLTPAEHKQLKGLDEQDSLRDHMDEFELIFSMLGERVAVEIHQTENSQGVEKLKDDAVFGGNVAQAAIKRLEQRLGRSVVSALAFSFG